jgi:hypothetical protein
VTAAERSYRYRAEQHARINHSTRLEADKLRADDGQHYFTFLFEDATIDRCEELAGTMRDHGIDQSDGAYYVSILFRALALGLDVIAAEVGLPQLDKPLERARRPRWEHQRKVHDALTTLHNAFLDADAVTVDMLRAPRLRELGPALHEVNYNEARGSIVSSLAFALRFTADEEEERGDPSGSGGAGPSV